jgi:hypothetical protein
MRRNFVAVAIGLVLGLVSVTTLADPPPWAPAHGARAKHQYQYRYYRSYQTPIYYAPERGLWFWMSGNNWQAGVNLPLALQPYTTGGISITLSDAQPYQQQAYVYQHYGRPQYRGDRHAWDRDHGDHGERGRTPPPPPPHGRAGHGGDQGHHGGSPHDARGHDDHGDRGHDHGH